MENTEAKTIKLDWSCMEQLEHPIFVEGIEPLSTRGPTHQHHHDAHDQMCESVKKELCIQQYAKIDIRQQSAAQKQCYHLMSIVSSCVEDSDSRVVPNDIVNLLCAFYPLFYWNPHYITLQSTANIFIMHKECCKLSELLCAYIEDDIDSLVITDIDSGILELVIKYLVHMHCEEVKTIKQSECSAPQMFQTIPCRWDEDFIESFGYKTVFQMHAAAKKMQCESLVELASDRLAILDELAPPQMDEQEHRLAQTIETMLDCQSLRFNVRVTCTSKIDIA